GYSKGLVRGPIAERFPGLGLERKKKTSALDFAMKLLRREVPPAWERLAGPKTLAELGVVDRRILDAERSDMVSNGNGRQLHSLCFLLNLESWTRAQLGVE